MNKVKALVTSNSKYRIVQHYRNGINIGDDLLFITKMALRGHLLTDKKYAQYIDDLFRNDEEPVRFTIEELKELLGEQQ